MGCSRTRAMCRLHGHILRDRRNRPEWGIPDSSNVPDLVLGLALLVPRILRASRLDRRSDSPCPLQESSSSSDVLTTRMMAIVTNTTRTHYLHVKKER